MNEDKKIITKIELQKRNKERVNVYINEEFAFACSAELVYNHNLCKGKIIDLKILNDIIEQDNYIKCKSTSLKIIERTYKTESQMKNKLLDKGYAEKIVNRTIDFLKEYKFLDDEKFIWMYIKDKVKTQGRKKIKYALLNKGLNEDLINEALTKISTYDEESSARKIGEKKYKAIIKTEKDYKKVYKKMGEYLYRNGYNSDIVKKVLKDIITLNKEENPNKQDCNKDLEELKNLAQKRYNIIIKSERDNRKIYKKLGDYLLRRGYSFHDIKEILNSIIEGEVL